MKYCGLHKILPELGLWTKTNKLCRPRRFNIHHTCRKGLDMLV